MSRNLFGKDRKCRQLKAAVLTIVCFALIFFLERPAHAVDKFEPTVESLKAYECPEWFRDAKFGYKDFIPMWKAEKFDPDRLVALFKQAGAKYFTPCATHHDNFDLWDSKHHRYNSVNMGPKKDITGMWRRAAVKHGLRFGVTTHLARTYSWFQVNKGADKSGPHAGVPYDGHDPAWRDFYLAPSEETNRQQPKNAPEHWRKTWALRM